MKVTLSSSLLTFASVALADSVYFLAQDSKTGAQLALILDKHEESGGSYWFLGGPSFYDYDPSTNVVSTYIGTNKYQFGLSSLLIGKVAGVFMTNRAGNTQPTYDANGKINNYNFFACTSVNDPKRLSPSIPVIMVNAAGNSTLPAPSCTQVDIFKKSASNIGPGANNGTVTSYTTFCPLPTVITITSCGTQTCAPTPITVTAATTITCAQCIAPGPPSTATVAPPAPASVSTMTYAGAVDKTSLGSVALVGAVAALLI